MKFIGFVLAAFCMVAYAKAQLESEPMEESYNSPRFRREANPQGSIVIEGQKPLGGPDRRPSLDVDYQHRVYDRNGMTADAFGGLNVRPGQAAQPHLGLQFERNYRDGSIGGFGQVQRGPGGRPSPTIGINGRFRFRRHADNFEGEEEKY